MHIYTLCILAVVIRICIPCYRKLRDDLSKGSRDHVPFAINVLIVQASTACLQDIVGILITCFRERCYDQCRSRAKDIPYGFIVFIGDPPPLVISSVILRHKVECHRIAGDRQLIDDGDRECLVLHQAGPCVSLRRCEHSINRGSEACIDRITSIRVDRISPADIRDDRRYIIVIQIIYSAARIREHIRLQVPGVVDALQSIDSRSYIYRLCIGNGRMLNAIRSYHKGLDVLPPDAEEEHFLAIDIDKVIRVRYACCLRIFDIGRKTCRYSGVQPRIGTTRRIGISCYIVPCECTVVDIILYDFLNRLLNRRGSEVRIRVVVTYP